jgi:excinuclease ABC subunit A
MVSHNKIIVVGARENNLKNITVEIPRDQLVVVTGLSGSGKSSLAFETIYAEGQRRYVESLSAYARQFLGQMDKPEVDHIEGLSPAVSIDQKTASKNPRSTVGTVTEIYDYLRILFARVGIPYCINGHGAIQRQSTEQIIDIAKSLADGTKVQILAPIVRGRKGEYKKELQEIARAGYVRVRVDGEMFEVTDDIPMDRYKQHTIEVVVDRLVVKEGIERRMADSIEAALKMGKGMVQLTMEGTSALPETVLSLAVQQGTMGENDRIAEALFSESYSCPVCGYSLPELEPRVFSFNSPYGACPDCTGLGTKTEFDLDLVAPDIRKPLRDGAILPFVYKSGEVKDWWPDMLDAVGRVEGFDASLPIGEIPPEKLHAVWFGLDHPITVEMKYGRGTRTFTTEWKGVLASLKKRYEETESEWVKQDLDQYMSTRPCPTCSGKRLKPETLSVKVADLDMSQITTMSIDVCHEFFAGLPAQLSSRQMVIAERVVKEVLERLNFLTDVGLGYLTLDRSAKTLSGGEAQRIRLASQIGSGLMGVLYVLDEPSIGLHQRDNHKLIETLKRLRDLGNTVLVVEHDEETMLEADWLIELGPGAGEHGGHVTAAGNVADFTKSDAITAQYLRGEKRIDIPMVRRQPRSGNPLLPSAVPRTVAVAPVPVKTKKGAKTAEAKAAKPRKARSI